MGGGRQLIEGFELENLLADKGYDANYIVEYVGIDKAVILSWSLRINPREYDSQLYKERNLVERMLIISSILEE